MQADYHLYVLRHDDYESFVEINFNRTIFSDPNNRYLSPWLLCVIVVYSVVTLAGLVSNLCVLRPVILILAKDDNTVISVFVYVAALTVLNLAVVAKMTLTITDTVSGDWPFSRPICKIYWQLENLHKTLSSVILSLLSVACYCAVCRPEMTALYKSKVCSVAHVMAGAILVSAFTNKSLNSVDIVHFVLLETHNHRFVYFGHKCLFHPRNDRDVFYYSLYLFLCSYIIPTLSMIACYGFILYSVRFRSPFHKRRIGQFRRMARHVLLLMCFYLVSWTPYWTVFWILYVEGIEEESFDGERGENFWTRVGFVLNLFPYIYSAFSTLLYCLYNKRVHLLGIMPAIPWTYIKQLSFEK